MPDSVTSSPSPRSSTASHRVHPIGADYLGGGLTAFRVWAPAASRRTVIEGDRRRAELGGRRVFQRDGELGAGARYWFRLIGGEAAIRIPHRAFNRTGPHGPSEVIDPRRSSGPTRMARLRARRPGDLRDAHRHVHAGRHVGGRRASSCRELADLGVTALEVMPVADFPDDSAGATTASICSRRRVCTASPTTSAASSIAPTRSASASSSTSSTTTSDRTATTSERSRRSISPTVTRTNGAMRSTSTATMPGRCASSSSRTPATGSTSFISTACASTRRSRSSTRRPSTSSPTLARRARAAAGRAHASC